MIRRIEALNYRSLRYVSQELQPFQVLIGPNASGKSTFLDIFRLVSDFVRYQRTSNAMQNPDWTRLWKSGVGQLSFNQKSDSFALAINLSIPDNIRNRFDNKVIRETYDLIRYQFVFNESYSVAESVWLINSSANGHEKAQSGHQVGEFPNELSPSEASEGWKLIIKKDFKGTTYLKSEEGKLFTLSGVGGYRSVLADLNMIVEDEKLFPATFWLRNTLINNVHVLAIDTESLRQPPIEIKRPFASVRNFSHKSSGEYFEESNLDANGGNLPLVIRYLSRNHPVAYNNWLAHIQGILPEIESIHIHERPQIMDHILPSSVYLAIKYSSSNEPVPSWLVSDGTLRLLALTIIAYIPEPDAIYLIEEPENGLHPSAIEGLYETLSSVYDGQVLITTHSPLLLGLAEPEQILCFTRDPSGATSIIRGDHHPVLRNWQGEVALSTLYASGVLG